LCGNICFFCSYGVIYFILISITYGILPTFANKNEVSIMPLIPNHSGCIYEAGCDEAGRGCLAGPVFAAAVILPLGYENDLLNDSKKLNEQQRLFLKEVIENEALAYSVAMMDAPEIDKYNILWASVRTMHLALDNLGTPAAYILVDGHKFLEYKNVPHECMIKGDGRFMSIAAASILAKTYRDAYMEKIGEDYPQYQWSKNKGYPTKEHREAIKAFGITPFHRKSFRLLSDEQQLKLF